MSEALVKTCPELLEIFKKSGKNVCPHGYVRGAQDLAAILNTEPTFGVHNMGWTARKSEDDVPKNVIGVQGIIAYMQIPGFSGQGHIDLWNSDGPVGDQYWKSATIWLWRLV
jgi:hypothetical protein